MTDDRSLERAARSWLETGPTEAPDRAVAAALLQIQTTTQERDWHVPWRTRPMTQTTRLLGGAAAIAVVLVGGALILRPGGNTGIGATASPPAPASSSPSSSPAASPVAAIEKPFTSVRYGYTVSHPALWVVTPATKSWLPGTGNAWGSGLNDEVSSTTARFSGAAQLLPAGQTAEAWLQTYAGVYASAPGSSRDPADWPTVTIDGQAGRIAFDGVAASGSALGGRAFDAVVVSGRVAYNFNMDGAVDRATFEHVLSTIKLADVPALDTGFVSPRGGYSIQRPSAWTVTPATRSWTSGYETQAFSDHVGSAPTIDGTSMKLPAGTTFDPWFAAYDADRVAGTACGHPSSNEDITIDGVVGHLDVHCAANYLEAVVAKGGRIYVFTMFTPFSRPLFESLVATIDLTPATATATK